MSKKNYRSKKGKPHTSFVKIDRYVFKTAAWKSLTPADKAIYLIILFRYNGSNNGNIGLSIRDASKGANVAKETARKSFKHLEDKGFIKKRFEGSFSQKQRLASEWELTHVPFKNKLPTKEFTRFQIDRRKKVYKSVGLDCKLENHNVL